VLCGILRGGARRREGAAWTVRHPPGRPQEEAAYVQIYEFSPMTAVSVSGQACR